MLQNASDLDLSVLFRFMGSLSQKFHHIEANRWNNGQDFAGTNPRYETLYWNSHFTNTVAGLFTIYLSKTVWADDKQNSGLVNFRLGMVFTV